MSKKTVAIKSMLIAIALSVLLSLAIYITLSTILVAVFYSNVPAGERNFTPIYVCMQIFFLIAFYIVYIRRYELDYEPAAQFDLVQDFIAYLRGNGKRLLVILAIIAASGEIASMIFKSFNPITFASNMCFPIKNIISVPVLRTIVGYIVTSALILFAVTLSHYRTFREWKKNGAI